MPDWRSGLAICCGQSCCPARPRCRRGRATERGRADPCYERMTAVGVLPSNSTLSAPLAGPDRCGFCGNTASRVTVVTQCLQLPRKGSERAADSLMHHWSMRTARSSMSRSKPRRPHHLLSQHSICRAPPTVRASTLLRRLRSAQPSLASRVSAW